MRRVLIIVAIILIPLVPIVLVVTGVIKKKPATVSKTTLTVWGTSDEKEAFASLIANYRKTRPYVSIVYEKKRAEDYSAQLVQAWAQGKGPDIFFVPNTWVGEMSSYAISMPDDLTISQVQTTKGVFGTQTTVVRPTQKAPTLADIRSSLVDAASNDVIRSNKVWGLPLAMDTVALYANKDLLNNGKVFEPAKTWTELVDQISRNKLTIIDDRNTIVQSGVALGTTSNVPYSTDLLTLLMMQNGSAMIDESSKKASLNDAGGLEALNFYTSFAQPKKTTYSWNSDLSNARDSFIRGKVAYYFGTYADRKIIAASGLNWSVGPMLHLDARGDNDAASGSQRFIDIARYEVGMVAKATSSSRKSVLAWNLLQYMARSGNVESYLSSTSKLSALKKVLAKQQADQSKAVFTGQLLTARSWYHGRNITRVEQSLQSLINSVVITGTDPKEVLRLASDQVEATL